MKNKYTLVLTFLAMFSIVACGEKDDNSLEGKKAKLEKLLADQSSLSDEIEKLQNELEVLEPNTDIKVISVKAMPLIASNFQHFVEASGRLEAENNVFATPQMGGALTSVKVKVGDFVKKGQVIATIDNTIMRNSLQEIDIQIATARTLFEKQENLWNQKIGTEVQYIQAKAQLEGLERRLKTLKSQDNLNVVTAPISGMIDEVRMKVGEMAAPGLGIARIVNLSELKVVVKIPDTYAGTIQKGDIVNINFPDLKKDVQTKLRFVSQTVDPASRTFTAEASVPKVDKDLKPNLNAIVKINDQSKTGAITIPQNLIQRTDEGELVYIAIANGKQMTAKAVKVTTGLSYDGKIEILTGLSSGDVLITEGYQELVDGSLVSF